MTNTSEGIKYDSEKPKMNLLPPKAIVEVSKVLTLLKITKGYPLIVINSDKSLYGVISNGDIAKFFNSKRSS